MHAVQHTGGGLHPHVSRPSAYHKPAIDLQAKGYLLVAACRELQHKNALSAALLKGYSNFDDHSCPQFLDWLCDPSNYGTALRGDVSRALQNIQVEYLVSRQILQPDNILVHPSQSMPSLHQS